MRVLVKLDAQNEAAQQVIFRCAALCSEDRGRRAEYDCFRFVGAAPRVIDRRVDQRDERTVHAHRRRVINPIVVIESFEVDVSFRARIAKTCVMCTSIAARSGSSMAMPQARPRIRRRELRRSWRAVSWRVSVDLVAVAPGVVGIHLGEVVPLSIEQHETICRARRVRLRDLDVRQVGAIVL